MIDAGFNSLFSSGGGFIPGGIAIIGDWTTTENAAVSDSSDDWNAGEGISTAEGDGDDADLILDAKLGETAFADAVCKFREGTYFKTVEGGTR